MRPLRPLIVLAALAFAAPAAAQGTVKTEPVPLPKAGSNAQAKQDARGPAPLPEVIRDLSRLPEKVRATRERVLAAARSGDLNRVVTVMQSNEVMPVFSFGGERDPVAYWKAAYPDSEGLEALGILVNVLEMPFVHLDKGTPQEMYVWPYFFALPLAALSAAQRVELFRLVTGVDYKEMQEFGAYIFYRVGIAPDGVWHFFVAGD